jgi:hypothetical protein
VREVFFGCGRLSGGECIHDVFTLGSFRPKVSLDPGVISLRHDRARVKLTFLTRKDTS